MGITAALVFANLGSAYGTAKSGVGIVSVAVLKPELLFKSIIPVVMASVLGMYGMIIGILLKSQRKYYFLFQFLSEVTPIFNQSMDFVSFEFKLLQQKNQLNNMADSEQTVVSITKMLCLCCNMSNTFLLDVSPGCLTLFATLVFSYLCALRRHPEHPQELGIHLL